jgi:hypothetical protein
MGWMVATVKETGPFAHAVIALGIMAAAGLPLALARVRNAAWIAAALAIGFYWGREKRDHENRLRRPAADVWDQGFLPWEWSPKGMADFVVPLVACLLVALALHLIRRRGTVWRPTPVRNAGGPLRRAASPARDEA